MEKPIAPISAYESIVVFSESNTGTVLLLWKFEKPRTKQESKLGILIAVSKSPSRPQCT